MSPPVARNRRSKSSPSPVIAAMRVSCRNPSTGPWSSRATTSPDSASTRNTRGESQDGRVKRARSRAGADIIFFQGGVKSTRDGGQSRTDEAPMIRTTIPLRESMDRNAVTCLPSGRPTRVLRVGERGAPLRGRRRPATPMCYRRSFCGRRPSRAAGGSPRTPGHGRCSRTDHCGGTRRPRSPATRPSAGRSRSSRGCGRGWLPLMSSRSSGVRQKR